MTENSGSHVEVEKFVTCAGASRRCAVTTKAKAGSLVAHVNTMLAKSNMTRHDSTCIGMVISSPEPKTRCYLMMNVTGSCVIHRKLKNNVHLGCGFVYACAKNKGYGKPSAEKQKLTACRRNLHVAVFSEMCRLVSQKPRQRYILRNTRTAYRASTRTIFSCYLALPLLYSVCSCLLPLSDLPQLDLFTFGRSSITMLPLIPVITATRNCPSYMDRDMS